MSRLIPRFLSLSILLFICFTSNAQVNYQLSINSEPGSEGVINKYKLNKSFSDSIRMKSSIIELVQLLQGEGYLLSYLESLSIDQEQAIALIYVGSRFEWLALSGGNISPTLFRRIGFRDRLYQEKPFRYSEVANVQKEILDYAEQNGFPFAKLRLDSLKIEDNKFSAAFNFEEGPLIKFDSIKVEGSAHINSKFLGKYLGIEMGEPYNQKSIDEISRNINNLPYVRLVSNPKLTFQNSEATLIINLEQRRINQIDGIIGFLPNASNDNNLMITGQLDMELYNPFGRGRNIGVHWQKLRENSQNLALKYAQPNIFNTPIDFDFDFSFLKEDTLFTDRNLRLKLDYRLSAESAFSSISDFKTTNLLETSIYKDNTSLPELIDFTFNSYGLRFEWHNLDDVFVPKKGAKFWFEGAAGNKKIIQNNGIPDHLYKDVELKSFQYTFNLLAEKYWSLGKQLVLLNRFQGGQIVNDQLFKNDAYRLGGFNSIRGFNENEFYATTYSFLTTEARLFLDEFSYLSLFGDVAWLKSNYQGVDDSQIPFGIGAGISFSTNAGIFNFVYALGSAQNQKGLNLGQSKIHFGYISRF
jgi:outer membrane protein assembly factor BamA